MSTISEILHLFEEYKAKEIKSRFFNHRDIEKLIQQISKSNLFKVERVGESFKNRPLYLLKTGQGSTKVFLWSQMHGDEPTATMALFDLFNFFLKTDKFDDTKKLILEKCTLYFLPMVNPDGAEVFTRRNAQGIDINRDFHHQQSPEGRILRSLRDKIEPHFGFNLHDQTIRWSAGNTGNPATISLLAPAFDKSCTINTIRLKAIQVITGINKELQAFIPSHVGRFNDEFEPRAFGDNFQNCGTSTILIESGGYTNDREKQFNRKLVFGAIVSGLERIALNNYSKQSTEEYFLIPENSKRHFDIILRNCTLRKDDIEYHMDIGLTAEEELNSDKKLQILYKIEDAGDLTGFYGYEELNLRGTEIVLKNNIEPETLADLTVKKENETILSFKNGKITRKNI